MKRQIKNVVFDLGGVLIDWNPRHLFHKHMTPQEADWFLTHVCHTEWNEKQDAGRTWAAAVAEAIAQHPTQEKWIRMYHERWPEMISGPIDGTVDLLKKLHVKNTPLYALTNWSAETFPVARERFEFLNLFRGILVSGEERMKKPDPKIFELLAKRFGLSPSETLFIDDVEKNVLAAQVEGFLTHHFNGAQGLGRFLSQHGLIEIAISST